MGLKEFLELRNLTQSKLAKELGISKASMSRRASGETELTVGDLSKIYEAYSPLSEEEMQVLLSK